MQSQTPNQNRPAAPESGPVRPVTAHGHAVEKLEARRRALRMVLVSWLFGAAWAFIASGAILTRYAKFLGLSAFGFGVLAALPYAGALAQLPTSYFLE